MPPPPPSEREVLTWDLFGTASRKLAQVIADDNYQPDLILSIARGGLFVAGSLGYALSVKNIHLMNVEYYTGVDERLPLPVVLPPTPDLINLEHAKLLVADDVADTGHTLALVRDFCLGKVADVRAAVLYQKPQSVIDCEFIWHRTDRWIDFPWSSSPPVAGAGTAH